MKKKNPSIVVRLLLIAPLNLLQNGLRASHGSCSRGCIETTEQLLNAGAELEGRDTRGCTPLQEAAANGQMEMTEWLVEKGADLQSVDNYGVTPLHHAAMN